MQTLFNKQRLFSHHKPDSGTGKHITTQAYVHPCVINNQPHIVYPRGLATDSPGLFKQLSKYFSDLGYRLKEDQRHQNSDNKIAFKRRAWTPIILFTAGLFFESAACADIEIDIKDRSSLKQQTIELKLISGSSVRQKIKDDLNISPLYEKIEMPSLKERTAEVLFDVLQSKYQPTASDPKHIKSDLKTMADYYSSYPEIVSLFKALKDANWHLVYDEDDWTTIASGNIVHVDRAEVHFNTRSAAQLRLNDSCKQNPVCIASPADALLHELLHVHSMFNDTKTFLAQGGMNSALYPYQHERSIITQERQLYKTMTQQDGIKRPSRHSHAGRIVKANCSTCIK